MNDARDRTEVPATGGLVGRYRRFLSLPGTARLLLSSLAGRMPLGMTSLAVLLLVHQHTHSFAAAGIAVGAYTLMSASTTPLQGRLVNRIGGAPVLSSQYTLVGAISGRTSPTEAFAWMSTALVGGIAAGNAGAGPLVQAGGIGGAIALGCAATAVAALVTMLRRRRLAVAVTVTSPSRWRRQ